MINISYPIYWVFNSLTVWKTMNALRVSVVSIKNILSVSIILVFNWFETFFLFYRTTTKIQKSNLTKCNFGFVFKAFLWYRFSKNNSTEKRTNTQLHTHIYTNIYEIGLYWNVQITWENKLSHIHLMCIERKFMSNI